MNCMGAESLTYSVGSALRSKVAGLNPYNLNAGKALCYGIFCKA